MTMGVLSSIPPEVFRCILVVMLLQVPMAAPQTYAEMNAVYTDKVHASGRHIFGSLGRMNVHKKI